MEKKIIKLMKEIKMEHCKYFRLKGLMRNPDFNMFVVSFFTVTGFLPFYVLYLLSKKDCYGQEIIKALADAVNNTWIPNPGIIYPLLRDFKKGGFIIGKWDTKGKHPKYIYHLTDKGMEEYKKMHEIMKIKVAESKKMIEEIEKEVFSNG